MYSVVYVVYKFSVFLVFFSVRKTIWMDEIEYFDWELNLFYLQMPYVLFEACSLIFSFVHHLGILVLGSVY